MRKINKIGIIGCGWLGFPLTKYLINRGFFVKSSTRSLKRHNELLESGLQTFILDIDNPQQQMADFLQTDLLIINITSKNVQSYTRLINDIELAGVKKVIFISSTSVYANINKEIGEEDNAEDKNSLLFQIEQMFVQTPAFLTSIVRFSGLIGYSRHPGRFFRSGKVIPQAEAPVNLIHRDDCIGIISSIIEREVWGEILNACADTHPSKREFYSFARKLLNLQAPEFANDSAIGYKIISNQKVKRMLGYQFKFPDVMTITYD